MKSQLIFLMILLSVILIISCKNTNQSVSTQQSDTIKKIITQPLKNDIIPYMQFEVNPEKDTSYIYRTGSKILIPKNAFLDSQGNIIKEKVKLVYREFTNALDVYLAGIPMQYDSAGTNMVFETAGMIEINGYSNSKPVFVNPNSKIQVQMTSFQADNRFNLYQLDTISGKWNYQGKDKIEKRNLNNDLSKLPEVPPAPKKAGVSSFSIGDNTGKYPELAIYKNVLFEPVDGKNCGFSGTSITATDLKNGTYEIKFAFDAYGAHKEEKCICYLAFKEGVDYDNALKIYQNKYKSQIEIREKKRKEIEKEWEIYNEAYKKYKIAFFEKTTELLKPNEKIIRAFAVQGFGFINVDKPDIYPQGGELIASYSDKDGKSIKLTNVVLVEKGRNALFRYENKIKFNPDKENILWGVTENNKIAFFKADEFKTIKEKVGNYTFKMNICEKELKSYEEILKVLF